MAAMEPGELPGDEPVAGGHVRLVKRAQVEGGGAWPLLRLFAPKMRRDTAQSLAALRKLLSGRGAEASRPRSRSVKGIRGSRPAG